MSLTYKMKKLPVGFAAGILNYCEWNWNHASYGECGYKAAGVAQNGTLESNLPTNRCTRLDQLESAQQLFGEFISWRLKNFNFACQAKKTLKPIALGLESICVQITNTIKKVMVLEKNVVALIPGTDQKDEYIIYSSTLGSSSGWQDPLITILFYKGCSITPLHPPAY